MVGWRRNPGHLMVGKNENPKFLVGRFESDYLILYSYFFLLKGVQHFGMNMNLG